LVAAWQSELPEVVTATTELTKRIMLLCRELDEATRRELPAFGLTPAEYDVLMALRRSGPPYRCKPNELTRSLFMSSGGTSNVVNHLVADGHVVREADPDDGRGTWVALTERGVALAGDVVLATSAAHASVFANASDQAIVAATEALRPLFAAQPPARRPVASDPGT
jgi:DNA-binding MarR family transcriptional regulator